MFCSACTHLRWSGHWPPSRSTRRRYICDHHLRENTTELENEKNTRTYLKTHEHAASRATLGHSCWERRGEGTRPVYPFLRSRWLHHATADRHAELSARCTTRGLRSLFQSPAAPVLFISGTFDSTGRYGFFQATHMPFHMLSGYRNSGTNA